MNTLTSLLRSLWNFLKPEVSQPDPVPPLSETRNDEPCCHSDSEKYSNSHCLPDLATSKLEHVSNFSTEENDLNHLRGMSASTQHVDDFSFQRDTKNALLNNFFDDLNDPFSDEFLVKENEPKFKKKKAKKKSSKMNEIVDITTPVKKKKKNAKKKKN